MSDSSTKNTFRQAYKYVNLQLIVYCAMPYLKHSRMIYLLLYLIQWGINCQSVLFKLSCMSYNLLDAYSAGQFTFSKQQITVW